MRNILVLTGGSDSDRTVFATALAAARPLAAHLEFFHVHLDPNEAALWQPHAEFARGVAMRNMMRELDARLVMRTAEARDHFCQFCEQHGLVVADQRHPGNGVTASWREEIGEVDRRMLSTARHYDLVVLARPTRPNGLPPDLLEHLLMGTGRPLLIVSAEPPPSLDTIMVCWKETAEAARAVAASMPFLANAKRVIIAAVEEGDPSLSNSVADLSRQLAWHGITARIELISSHGRPASEMLLASARSQRADLLVMGAYGHSRVRQVVFGGFTQSVIEAADTAVLMMH